MSIALLLSLALLLDQLLGEPRRWHPLVGFGRLAALVERHGYQPRRARGSALLLMLVLPPSLLAATLASLPSPWGEGLGVLILYLALGWRSLGEHLRPVAEHLASGDDGAARQAVARVVSRDAATLDIAPAAVESALENGNDAVFGALFWFLLAGPGGVVAYRLTNTLDAMWGYHNQRYGDFGWAAARLDDLMNYLPARLTALTYALLGATRAGLRCWRRQAPAWDSPNAGPVMAAGAGALGLRLGGPARYNGHWHPRPELGQGRPPEATDILRALGLVNRGVALWLAVCWMAAMLGWLATATSAAP